MHWVYILCSTQDQTLYIGQTSNLRQRISDHNNGKSAATKLKLPWKLVYLEAYASKQDALNREKRLKNFGQAYRRLKERIEHSLRGD